MSLVYLVTKGDYDEYHVAGVCSTLDKAQALADAIGGNDVEAKELDQDLAPMWVTAVKMMRDGFVVSTHTVLDDSVFVERYPEIHPTTTASHVDLLGRIDPKLPLVKPVGILSHRVNTNDKDCAIKRTNEVREQLIAQSLFPDHWYFLYGMPWGYASKILNATIRAVYEPTTQHSPETRKDISHAR